MPRRLAVDADPIKNQTPLRVLELQCSADARTVRQATEAVLIAKGLPAQDGWEVADEHLIEINKVLLARRAGERTWAGALAVAGLSVPNCLHLELPGLRSALNDLQDRLPGVVGAVAEDIDIYAPMQAKTLIETVEKFFHH